MNSRRYSTYSHSTHQISSSLFNLLHNLNLLLNIVEKPLSNTYIEIKGVTIYPSIMSGIV